MPPDPGDMARAIAKVAAHEGGLPILARATGEPGGAPPEPPSQFAELCRLVAALARKVAGYSMRLSAVEARPVAQQGPAGRDGVSVTGIRVDEHGHLRVTLGGAENDLGSVRGESDPAAIARLEETINAVRASTERPTGAEMTDAEFSRRVQAALGRPVEIGDNNASE